MAGDQISRIGRQLPPETHEESNINIYAQFSLHVTSVREADLQTVNDGKSSLRLLTTGYR